MRVAVKHLHVGLHARALHTARTVNYLVKMFAKHRAGPELRPLDAGNEIELDEHEKPHIKGHGDISFNISHSGEVVCLGISDKEIGVDVEKVKHFKESLIDYVFMPQDQELAKELAMSESDMDKVYTRLWTVKESIMKHCGKGISLSPKNILLRLEDGKIKASSAACDCEALNLMPYEIDDYQITVCSEYEDFTLLKPF